jgi:hypothetical protein
MNCRPPDYSPPHAPGDGCLNMVATLLLLIVLGCVAHYLGIWALLCALGLLVVGFYVLQRRFTR